MTVEAALEEPAKEKKANKPAENMNVTATAPAEEPDKKVRDTSSKKTVDGNVTVAASAPTEEPMKSMKKVAAKAADNLNVTASAEPAVKKTEKPAATEETAVKSIKEAKTATVAAAPVEHGKVKQTTTATTNVVTETVAPTTTTTTAGAPVRGKSAVAK